MSDIQSQIAAAQSNYYTQFAKFDAATEAERDAQNALTAAQSSGNSAQIAAAQAAHQTALDNLDIVNASVSAATAKLSGLQNAYNTGLSQSSNPAQQQAIASAAYTTVADSYRNGTLTTALDAANDPTTSPGYLDYLKGTAITAEEGYQASLEDATVSSDIATVQIASSLKYPDLTQVVGSTQVAIDDGSAGDTPGDPAQPVTDNNDTVEDNRLRIKPFSEKITDFVNDPGVLAPLVDTNGVIFPYTPGIHFTNSVTYQQVSPTHANTDYWVYANSPAVHINIEAQFTAQTEDEAKYLLAAAHFFRASTKMRFGANDPDRGFAPPILKLYGYGTMTMKALPVVVISFSEDLPNNVNYVEVTTSQGKQWVPSLTTFQLECVVQQTPAQHRDEFTWDDFASGKLMTNGGWI